MALMRSDVRRFRQRRRVAIDPLATTVEATEQKLLANLTRILEAGRTASKTRQEEDGTSARFGYAPCVRPFEALGVLCQLFPTD